MKRSVRQGLVILFLLPFLLAGRRSDEGDELVGSNDFVIESTAFDYGDSIDSDYTCDGSDVSPQFQWSGAPAGTQGFVLISDDPDAPVGTWVHWVYYDIPATVGELREAFPPDERPELGGAQGITDFRRIGYGGPCPPGGTHRYFFKLYALDTVLGLAPGATKRQVLQAAEGHILAQAELMGTYTR